MTTAKITIQAEGECHTSVTFYNGYGVLQKRVFDSLSEAQWFKQELNRRRNETKRANARKN